MMRFFLRPVTIQARLLALFVVAAALPLAVVSLIAYHNSVESVEKMVGNRTSRLAVSVGEDLSQKLRRRLGDRILLVNEPVQRYLQTPADVDPGARVTAYMDLQSYTASLFEEYGRYYREMILADEKGTPVFRYGRSRGTEEAVSRPTAARPAAPEPPTFLDTLAVILPEEIPLPGQMEKKMEAYGRALQARLRETERELKKAKGSAPDAPSLPEVMTRIREALSRSNVEIRDPDFIGPEIPSDPRLPTMILDSYRSRFTEDERLAARTGAQLGPDENMIFLHHGVGGQAEAVRLVRPVFSVSEPDKRLGVLLLDLRVDYLFPEDLSGERFGSKGDLAVVNRKDGEILYHTRPDLVGQSLRIVSPELSAQMEKAADEKGSPWFSVKDQGSRRLGAVFAIDAVPWMVVATAFPREFETEARQAGLLNLAVASAAVLLALGFLLVSSRKISHSVHIVTEGAREIAAGNLDHTIRVGTRDEIQTLAETFNTMTASLRENIALREKAAGELEALNRTLEDRVADRTRELQALNEALGRANQELQELDRLKSNFLATVSHEFKTPLTSITAFSEILADEMEERREASPEVLRFLNIINNESGRLGRLIRNLLDLSRIEARRMRWEHSTFRVRDVVDASLDGLLPVFSEKNIQVHHTIDCPDAKVHADRDRLQQVITNLIENAVKFSNRGSRIWIDCHESNHAQNGKQYLEFSVRDEGPGIPPAHLVRIFERFTQVDNTDTRGTGGSGLGLAISKEIVEHHGGTIWVDSDLGTGATFHFTIPRLGDDT
jgi:signal transduction histidine kinase